MTNFLIICNKNAYAYNEVFPLLMDKQLHIGYTHPKFLGLEGLCRWLTTFKPQKKPLIANSTYCPYKYPHYDQYDIIEVSKIKDMPIYDGKMGVPITIFDWDIQGYEVLGILKGEYSRIEGCILGHQPSINGKNKYHRVIIQKL